MKTPKAIIEDGKVVNHEELKRYWSDWRFRQDRIQRGMFQDIREQEEPQELVPDTPEWARNQWDSVRQLRAMVNHVNQKVTEMRAKKKDTF